jgi:hypothetical protein
MKKLLTFAVGLGLVFTIAGTASAISNPSDWNDGDLAGGVLNSRHNLGSTGVHYRADNASSIASSMYGGGGTSEVCIFCHTPHHGSTNAPLWNKGNQGAGSYTSYGTTVAGTSTGTIGAATLACLSCHDGVNTFNTIVNWPGKSGSGTNASAGTTHMSWLLTEDGNTQSDYMTSGRLNLGTDLTNDHPVSIAYTELTAASLRASSTVISTVTMDNAVITTGDGDSTESRTEIRNRWSVSGYINTGASISDLLRSDNVECSSCHDPHFKNQSWDEVASTWAGGDEAAGSDDMDGLFLRRVGGNSLSGVCRTCHAK